jgi:hypothetical protein
MSVMSAPEDTPKPPSTAPKENKPSAPLNLVTFGKPHEICLEQYKAYLSDLGNVGSRYATLQGFYVSVIGALLGLLALTESNKLLGQIQTGALIVVCLFSIALCIVWALTIRFYGRLFLTKFAILKALECHLAYNCFEEEYKLLKPKPFLTRIESWIPIVLSLFFAAIAGIRLIGHQSPPAP